MLICVYFQRLLHAGCLVLGYVQTQSRFTCVFVVYDAEPGFAYSAPRVRFVMFDDSNTSNLNVVHKTVGFFFIGCMSVPIAFYLVQIVKVLRSMPCTHREIFVKHQHKRKGLGFELLDIDRGTCSLAALQTSGPHAFCLLFSSIFHLLIELEEGTATTACTWPQQESRQENTYRRL